MVLQPCRIELKICGDLGNIFVQVCVKFYLNRSSCSSILDPRIEFCTTENNTCS
jgi:hypothetical protein